MNTPNKTVGWRERLELPELGLEGVGADRLIAKIDTGARTSALHATDIQEYTDNDITFVSFLTRYGRRKSPQTKTCTAPVFDKRIVVDSGGHSESRYIIQTTVRLAGCDWPIDISLTDRSTMKYPMLLGRTAVSGRFLVNPQKSWLTREKSVKSYINTKVKPLPHIQDEEE